MAIGNEHTDSKQNECDDIFKSLFEHSSIPQLLIEGQHFVDCNKKALEIIGYSSKEEIVGRGINDISPEIQSDGVPSQIKFEQLIKKAHMDGPLQFEWTHLKTNGEKVYTTVMLAPIKIHGSSAIHTAWWDITSFKYTEETLRESEERYRRLADLAFEGLLIHKHGIAHDVNLAFCRMFGYERDELIGKNVIERIVENEYKQLAYQHADNQSPDLYEILVRNKNGARMWVEVHGTSLIYNGERIRTAAMRDITNRKTSEEALRESEEKFRRITELSLDVFLATDAELIIRFVSPSITRYTGYRPEELIGKKIDYLNPIKEARINNQYISDALLGNTVGLFESRVLRKDGSLADIEMSIVPIIKNNQITALEFYSRDISDRKKLEREIIRTSELERQRIGRDLHDGLGQMLTGISIMIGTVARKVKLHKKTGYAEIMRIAKMAGEAIDTAQRIARGLNPVTMDSGGLITALLEMANNVKINYGINCFVNHLGSLAGYDNYVANQVCYIANEAINNAIKHSNTKNIHINILSKDKKINFSVENDGSKKSKKINANGMGLKIMQYRSDIIGASFNAARIKNGFKVQLELCRR